MAILRSVHGRDPACGTSRQAPGASRICSPPVPLAAFDPLPTPFVVLMGVGFLVGTVGHVYKSKTLIVTGISLIFMATLGLPLGLYLSDR